MQTFKIGDQTDSSLEDCAQLIVDLLSFGQTLFKQTHKVSERLCKEVVRATQGSARLLLPCLDSSTGRHVAFPVSVSFPVRFRNRIFGTLEIATDPVRPANPALPLPVAQLLANICGSLLYTLELAAFIEGQCQRLDYQDPGLAITPATVDTHRKRISEKLGVHCERDIPLAAYQAQLFSILE